MHSDKEYVIPLHELKRYKSRMLMDFEEKNWEMEISNYLDEAFEAMKKQIPKQVTEFVGDGGHCPVCHMHNLDVFRYCSCCGQKLDWSGLNGEG